MCQTKVAEKTKAHILGSIFFFFRKSFRLRDNVENTTESDRPQMPIWRKRIACWVTTDTNTHSEYVILIAFPRPQCVHERASLFYLYIHCLSSLMSISVQSRSSFIANTAH
jgi:hypothetical protein